MKINRKSGLGLITALLASTAVNADDFVADAPISAVKIHRNYGAIVTRSFSIELPAGQHTISIPQLTDQLDEGYALRASVVSGNASINQVQLDKVFLPNVGREAQSALLAELETLETAQANDRSAIEAINMQLSFIQGMAKDAAAGGDYSSPADMMEALEQTFEFVKSNSGTLLSERQTMEQTLKMRSDKIKAIRREIDQLGGKRERANEITLNMSSPSGGISEITVDYLVTDATWDIASQANLDSSSQQTKLKLFATIQQESGEDWLNAELSLSTTRPSFSIGHTAPPPVYLNIQDNNLRAVRRLEVAKLSEPSAPAYDMEEVVVTGSMISTQFDAEFKLPAAVSISSDGSEQSFMLGEYTASSTLVTRITPVQQETAYVYGDTTFENVPFIVDPEVSITRDRSFVGSGYWPTIENGKNLKLPFGSDPKIAVEVVTIPSEDGDEGIFNRKRVDETKKQFRITNNHKTSMTIEVFDALPNSMNEDMEVELLNGNTRATETDYGDQPGVVMWRETVAPGETWVINHWYRVSFPTDKRVVYQ